MQLDVDPGRHAPVGIHAVQVTPVLENEGARAAFEPLAIELLEVGALRLDPAARKCWVEGGAVELTAREFSILEYMMRQSGTVLSKLEILENVWDFGFDGDPNIVEVYVGRLRQKLSGGQGRPAITTIRGAGYRLDA